MLGITQMRYKDEYEAHMEEKKQVTSRSIPQTKKPEHIFFVPRCLQEEQAALARQQSADAKLSQLELQSQQARQTIE